MRFSKSQPYCQQQNIYFLEIYFDPATDRRLNVLKSLRALYERQKQRGKTKYEL